MATRNSLSFTSIFENILHLESVLGQQCTLYTVQEAKYRGTGINWKLIRNSWTRGSPGELSGPGRLSWAKQTFLEKNISLLEVIRINDFIPLTSKCNSHKLVIKNRHNCGKCRTWSWDAGWIRWLCHAELPVDRNWCDHISLRNNLISHDGQYENVINAPFPSWNRLVHRIAEPKFFLGNFRESIGATSWAFVKPLQDSAST